MKQKNVSEGILFTDFYELTMAQLYYHMGLHQRRAQFDYFFRKYPNYGAHQAGYCIYAGMGWLMDWMQGARFDQEVLEHLRGQTGRSGKPVFSQDFLNWLYNHGDFNSLDIQAVPEGRIVHPISPLAVVQGPLIMAQILESALLNHLNYQTLIATKAARIKEAGQGELVLEFGMRRGQDKGANAGVRAALIGGADFSSNSGISYALGYPPKGTHAHSMIQVFMALGEGELGAFRAYAQIYPDDCLLLVDTIDTLNSGIPNAIKVFEELKRKGHTPVGIRLDSGDLAYLSIQAAMMLNDAGFPDTRIVLSNQLDELVIWQIISQIRQEAPRYGIDPDHLIKRLIYGVGTRLITSKGHAALDGVYKIVAIQEQNEWLPALKISDTTEKIINPGNKRLWRIYDNRNKAIADLMTLDHENPRDTDQIVLHHHSDGNIYRILSQNGISEIESILTYVIKDGKPVDSQPSIEDMRRLCRQDLARLDPGVKRLISPHIYHVSVSGKLWDLKYKLIQSVKKET